MAHLARQWVFPLARHWRIGALLQQPGVENTMSEHTLCRDHNLAAELRDMAEQAGWKVEYQITEDRGDLVARCRVDAMRPTGFSLFIECPVDRAGRPLCPAPVAGSAMEVKALLWPFDSYSLQRLGETLIQLSKMVSRPERADDDLEPA